MNQGKDQQGTSHISVSRNTTTSKVAQPHRTDALGLFTDIDGKLPGELKRLVWTHLPAGYLRLMTCIDDPPENLESMCSWMKEESTHQLWSELRVRADIMPYYFEMLAQEQRRKSQSPSPTNGSSKTTTQLKDLRSRIRSISFLGNLDGQYTDALRDILLSTVDTLESPVSDDPTPSMDEFRSPPLFEKLETIHLTGSSLPTINSLVFQNNSLRSLLSRKSVHVDFNDGLPFNDEFYGIRDAFDRYKRLMKIISNSHVHVSSPYRVFQNCIAGAPEASDFTLTAVPEKVNNVVRGLPSLEMLKDHQVPIRIASDLTSTKGGPTKNWTFVNALGSLGTADRGEVYSKLHQDTRALFVSKREQYQQYPLPEGLLSWTEVFDKFVRFS